MVGECQGYAAQFKLGGSKYFLNMPLNSRGEESRRTLVNLADYTLRSRRPIRVWATKDAITSRSFAFVLLQSGAFTMVFAQVHLLSEKEG